jgi:hypothetical protein
MQRKAYQPVLSAVLYRLFRQAEECGRSGGFSSNCRILLATSSTRAGRLSRAMKVALVTYASPIGATRIVSHGHWCLKSKAATITVATVPSCAGYSAAALPLKQVAKSCICRLRNTLNLNNDFMPDNINYQA